ncbi:early nodulin protein [Trifolium repens]|nr:early nodulin protein [Trifolium repens]
MNMASSSSPILLIIIFSILSLLISCSESTEHMVGDDQFVWKVPLSSPDDLTLWSSSHNFTVGDTIVFRYNTRRESVREVMNEHDFIKCNTKGQFMRLGHDGYTRVVLDKPGIHYFMSGWKSHCKRGLKVAILVISPTNNNEPLVSMTPLIRPSLTLPRHSPKSSSPSPSPSLSPSPSPSPNSSGSKGGAIGCGFIILLGVSLMTMMMFLI